MGKTDYDLDITSDLKVMQFKIVELTDGDRIQMVDMVAAAYADEPCRICGKNIEHEDLRSAVCAGYSRVTVRRAAHGSCWSHHGALSPNDDKAHWAIPE